MHPIAEFQWIDVENLTEFRACRNSIQGALLIVDERGTMSCKNTHIGYNTTVHVTIPKDGPYSRYRPRLLVCPLKYHVISLLYHQSYRASDNSRGCRPANFPKKREIRQKYFQIHVGETYFILILGIRPVLFTPNIQIYLETSSLQRVNNIPKLPGVFR